MSRRGRQDPCPARPVRVQGPRMSRRTDPSNCGGQMPGTGGIFKGAWAGARGGKARGAAPMLGAGTPPGRATLDRHTQEAGRAGASRGAGRRAYRGAGRFGGVCGAMSCAAGRGGAPGRGNVHGFWAGWRRGIPWDGVAASGGARSSGWCSGRGSWAAAGAGGTVEVGVGGRDGRGSGREVFAGGFCGSVVAGGEGGRWREVGSRGCGRLFCGSGIPWEWVSWVGRVKLGWQSSRLGGWVATVAGECRRGRSGGRDGRGSAGEVVGRGMSCDCGGVRGLVLGGVGAWACGGAAGRWGGGGGARAWRRASVRRDGRCGAWRAVAGVGGSGAVGGGGLGLEAGDGGGGLAECGGVRVARGHRPLAVFAEVRAFRAETVAAFAGVWATQAEHSRRLGDLGVAVSYAVQARAGEALAGIALGARLDAMEARLAAVEGRVGGRG